MNQAQLRRFMRSANYSDREIQNYYDTSNQFGDPKLKPGYISSSTPIGGFKQLAQFNYKGEVKKGGGYKDPATLFIYEDPSVAANQQLAARQQAFEQGFAKTYADTQSNIANQLKILQGEKSAITKMTEDYTAMMKAEADARQKAQEEEALAQKVSAANMLRAGSTANLQLGQPTMPTIGGTQGFRRRSQQFNAPGSYGGLNTMANKTLNI